jgi:hypothetical protein
VCGGNTQLKDRYGFVKALLGLEPSEALTFSARNMGNECREEATSDKAA